jgi:hypothetical protein
VEYAYITWDRRGLQLRKLQSNSYKCNIGRQDNGKMREKEKSSGDESFMPGALKGT